ncbi:ImmA/IrrE family metallo-endopeptidase [Pseudoponticoccus marisrubri]|uniref:IrrE N-terminal-like domain-containing protein n=1 Tax=Pseudoponticoccus marisrubri TaxID=1685382 RepID=A0A0W7WQ75_9RHOB|nr:ImmA/IrrE family metallo-endopeptidase [Pseudoponticoccus marisrubri]KUF12679.1 hypothetical protein AVJ23_02885 [Pseudoponticoccus marisrubri]
MPRKYPDYPYVEMVAAGLPAAQIDAAAMALRRRFPEIALDRGDPLDPLCRALGVDLDYAGPPHEIVLDVPAEGRPVLYLPRLGRTRQDRVDAAMGIGHWILHVPPTRLAHPGAGMQALVEPTDPALLDEARRFALALLMPEPVFWELWYEGRAGAVAETLNVPTQFAYERAATLDVGHHDPDGAGPVWTDHPAP